MPGSAPACLVAGLNEERKALLMAAASNAGWEVVGCDDAVQAQRMVVIEPRQMVVVDLESASGAAPPSMKALCERLGRQKDVLLVLCGNSSNAIEEIWARQLGAWLYLPGVVDDSDLSSLFEEASQIARRRMGSARQQAYFPGGSV
ncbi:MAG: hypothetical protein K8T25_09820 [Planctomycetia bacterium]|nr:hypothetical protein [Planctomycetia bacterium]